MSFRVGWNGGRTWTLVAVVLLAGTMAMQAADGTWNVDASGSWSTAGNWSPVAVPGGAGSVVALTNNIAGSGKTVTIDTTPRTVGVLRLGDRTTTFFAFTLDASGGGTLTMDNTTNATIHQLASSGANVVSAPILLNGNLDVINSHASAVLSLSGGISANTAGLKAITNAGAAAGAVTISGAVSNNAGYVSITQNGTSPLNLNGANSFTGGVTLTSGTLTFGNASAWGNTPGTFTIGGGTLNSSVASLAMANDVPQTWNGNFTFTGTQSLNLGAGAVTLGNNVQITASANTLTVGGVIGGNFNLTKAGAGTLTLNGANTFGGVGRTVTINASGGTLIAGDPTALGDAATALQLNGGTLVLASDTSLPAHNATVGAAAAITVDRATSGSGITNTLGTLSIGNFTLTVNRGANVTSGTAGLTFGATTLSAATPVFNVASGVNLTLGALSGNFAFSKSTGTGTLTLSASSARSSGLVTLNAGTLALGNASALGSTGVTLTLTAGTLDLATDSSVTAYNTTVNGTATITANRATAGAAVTHTLGTLSIGAGDTLDVIAGANVTSGTAGLVFGATTISAATPVFDVASGAGLTLGALSGNFSFTKSGGAGTLYLNSGSARSGGTVNVNAGSLVLGSTSALGTTAATITLGGGTLDLATDSSVNAYNIAGVSSGSTILTDKATASSAGIMHTLGTLSIGAVTLTVDAGANVSGGSPGLTVGNVTLSASGAVFDVATGVQLTMAGTVTGTARNFTVQGAGNATINGAVGTTTGTVTKDGTGTLTLVGTSTYTGTTTMNDGVLIVNGTLNAGSAVSVNGGILAGTNTINGTVAVNSGGTLTGGPTNTVGTLNTGALTLSAGSVLEVEFGTTNDLVNVTGNLTVTGGGLRLYTENAHATYSTAGTYNLVRYSGSASVDLSALSVLNPAAGKSYAFGLSGGNLTLTISEDDTWNGGSGADSNWSTPANWSDGTTPVAGQALKFDSNNRVDNTNDFASGTKFTGITFNSGAGSFTLAGNTVNLAADVVNNSANPQTVMLPLTLDSGSRGLNAASNAIVIGGVIDDGASTWGISKSGANPVVLAGANTFDGTATVNAGAVVVSNANALGSLTGGTTVSSGGALQLPGGITTVAEALTLNGTGVAADGALRNTAGANTYAGTVTLGSASRINADAGTLTLNAATAISNGGNNLNVGGAGNVTVSGVIGSGAGTLTVDGTGVLTLSGVNTYTGTTTINSGGTLTLQSASGLGGTGGGTTVASGGALQLDGSFTTAAEALTLNGDGIASAGALRLVSGAVTYAGNISLAGDSRIIAESGTVLSLNPATSITASPASDLTIGGDGDIGAKSILTPIANLTKIGSGVLMLYTNASTYTGTTLISGGTLRLGTLNMIPSTPFTVDGGTFDNNGLADTVGALTLKSGLITGTGLITASSFTAESGTISSPLGGAVTFTKNTTGTVVLNANINSTYTGVTAIQAGVLNIRQAQSTGTTAGGVTVTNGAALELQGGITVGAEALSLNGTGVSAGGALRSISGNNAWQGAITLQSPTRVNSDTAGDTLTLSAATTFTGAQALTVGGDGNTTVSGIIATSTGSLTKDGSGTLTLSGANTFSGDTRVLAGTLTLTTAATALQNSTLDLNAADTGTVAFVTLTTSTFGGLKGTRDLVLQNTTPAALTLSVGNNNQSTAYSGVLSGSGGLTKIGTGTLTLSGTNSYDGATAISAGVVNIQNAAALGSIVGASTVASGSALEIQGGITTLAEGLTLSGSGVSLGGALRNVSGTNIFTGAITLGALAPTISSDSGLLILDVVSGNAIDSGAALALGFGGAGDILVADPIDTPVTTVVRNGAGRLTLSAANTHTGTTTANSPAIINIQHADALGATGSGTVVASGGVLEIEGGITTAAEPLTMIGSGVANGGALRNVANDNTYGGTITLTGASRINSDAGTLTLLGPGNISGATFGLTFGGAGNVTVQNAIATTSGRVSKDGTGTLTLAGTNTFTGATSITNGTLLVSGSIAGASPVTVYSGGVLGGTGTILGAVTNLSGGTVTAGASVGMLAINKLDQHAGSSNIFEFTNTSTYDQIAVSASGGLTFSASANSVQIYLFQTGTTNAWDQNGVYNLFTYVGTAPAVTGLKVANETSGKTYAFDAVGGVVKLTISGANVWDGGGTPDARWQTGANWAGDSAPAANSELQFDGAVGLNNTNDFAANTQFAGLTFLSGAGAFTLNGAAVNLTSDIVNSNANAQTINLDLVLDGLTREFNAGAGDVRVNGAIGETGGSFGVSKTGTNTLTLAGNGTFNGAVTINAGVLNVRNSTALGATAGGVTVSSSTAMQLQDGVAVGAEALSLSGTGVAADGALRSISGANSYAGAVTLGSAVRVNADADSLTLSGNISGAAQPLTIGGAGDVVIAGVIGTTSGTLTKDGAGTLTLGGTNTYTGATTISAGVVLVQAPAGLGTTAGGVVVSNGAALQLHGAIAVGAEALTLNGTGVSGDGALRNLAAANSYAGAITLGSAVRINSDAGTLTLSGGVTGAGQGLTVGGAGNVTVSSAAIGTTTGTLTKDGAGILLLSVANTYTGLTDVQAGTLRYGINNALAGGAVQISGGTLDMVTFSDTVGAVTLQSGIITGTSGVLTSTGFTVESGTASAILGGAVTLTKNTSGTVVLSATGNNTFTGATTINAGVLNIRHAGSLGTVAGNTTVVGDGAALELQGGIITLAEPINLNGTGVSGGGALRNVSGLNTNAGPITLQGASRINSDTGTLTLSSATAITGTFPLTFGGTGNTTVSGAITISSAALTKDGAGTLTLSGANTYTGGTVIDDGTVAIGASERLANTGAVTVQGGTLSIANFNETVATVTLTSGNITGTSGTLTGSVYNVESGTISARLGGSGALTKSTAGTVTLAGVNTYAGTTTVNAGTLKVNGSLAAGSAVTIGGSGATGTPTLAGTGTVAGSVTSSSPSGGVAGHLAPGDGGAGTLNTGALILGDNSFLDYDVGASTGDYITVTGNLTLGTNVTLNIVSGGPGVYALMQYSGSLTGESNLATWTVTGVGGTSTFFRSGNVIYVALDVMMLVTLPGETFTSGVGNTGTPSAQTAGTPFNIVQLTVVDHLYNVVTGYAGAKTISYTGPAGVPSFTTAVTFAGGVSTTTLTTTLTKAETTTITATDNAVPSVASASLTVNAGAFTKLQLLVPGETANPGSVSGKTGTPDAQTAGTGFTVTVNAVDANWNIISAATDTVSIASSDTHATLPADGALVSGTQTFNVTLKTAGSRTVTASDVSDGSKTANTSPSITVNAGAFTKLQLLLPGETASPGSVSGKTGTPTGQTAGTGFMVTVNAVDANWNLVNTVSDTVGITSSDAQATLPANNTLASGTRTFSVTLKTAPSQTVTATDISDGSKTADTSPATAVNPAVASKLSIQTQPSSVATAGVAFAQQPVILIQDAYDNLRTNDALTVNAVRNAGTGSLQGATNVTSVGGVATFTNLAHSVASSITITFSSGALASVTSSTVVVSSSGYTQLQILLPGETANPGSPTGKSGSPSAQTAGTGFNVTVNAVDANWNVVSATDTVHLVSTDANAVLPADAALVGGTRVFSVTNRTAGAWTLTATNVSDGAIAPNTSGSYTVNPGAFVKLQLLVPGEAAAAGTGTGKTGTPAAQTAGTGYTVTVNGVDANWNLVSSATGTVGITSTDANATLPANAALSSGSRTFSVTNKTAGSWTLTATNLSDGTKTANTSPSITVNAGAFTKLQVILPGETAAPGSVSGKSGGASAQTAGTGFNVTVNAVDANWNLISTNDTVSLTASDANAVLPANTALAAGSAVLSLTNLTAGAGQSVTASNVTDGAIAPNTSSTYTVNAGAFVKLQLIVPGETVAPGTGTGKTGAPNAQTAGTSYNVSVRAVDANWNLVSSTHTVGLTSTDANATLPANAALVAGVRNFGVTNKTAGVWTLTATNITSGAILPNTSPSVTVNAGAFTKLQLLVPGETANPGSVSGKTGSPSAQNTDTDFNVTVNAVDANWNLVNTVTDTVGITSSDANASLPANAALVAGTQTFNFGFNTAGSRTITATDISDGSKTANTSPSISVSVGAFVKLQILMPGESAAAGTASGKTGSPTARTAGTSFSVTVNAVDGNWNLVNTVTDTVGITSSDTYATLPANNTLAAGTRNFTVTLKTAGTQTVTATNISDGGKLPNTSPSTTVNPGTFTKMQLLVPGETADPGSPTGKTGTPNNQTAGVPFTVTVNSVDANWNVANSSDTVGITSSDAQATLPANAALVAGTRTFNVTLKTAGGRTVTASDITTPARTANTSPSITVVANTAAVVRVETAADGSGAGVAAQSKTSGDSLTAYSVTRDDYGNFVSNAAANAWFLTNITGAVAGGDLVPAGDSKSATFTANGAGTAVVAAAITGLTSTNSGTITVTAVPALSVNDVTVTEGNSGTSNAIFTVTLSTSSTLPTTFSFASGDGSASSSSDYTATNGTLTIGAGGLGTTVVVRVTGDTVYETNETFTLTLSNFTNATTNDATGVGTINNNDAAPSLSIGNATVGEGNAGTVAATFTVTQSAASGVAATFNYASSNVTATVAGGDYAAASGGLSIPAGATSTTLTVTVNGDLLYESNETYTVVLSGATHATISGATGTGTITNDDAMPVVTLAATPIDNVETPDTTPDFTFAGGDGDANGDEMTYQVQWSTNAAFSMSVTTRTSDSDAGFVNTVSGGDSTPFNEGEVVRFTIQAGDALANSAANAAYYWRVRSKETLGGGTSEFGDWSAVRSLRVNTALPHARWVQTTDPQFETDGLSSVRSSAANGANLEQNFTRSVEYVELTLAAGELEATAFLTKGQVTDNCVPFATMMANGAGEDLDSTMPDIYFETGGRISATRRDSVGTVTIGISVVEFEPTAVKVQQGNFNIGGTSGTKTIEDVDLTRAAMVFYVKSPTPGNKYSRAFVTGRFSDSNHVAFSRNVADQNMVGSFYVFEALGSEFSVQAASLSILGGASQSTAAIASVDTNKTFVIASYRTALEDSNPDQGHVGVFLSSATQITAQRYSTTNDISDIQVFAVTFAGAGSVQRGSFNYASGDSLKTATVAAVDTRAAMAWSGMTVPTGIMRVNVASDNNNRGYQKLTLANSTTIHGNRAQTGHAAEGRWEVVEWPYDFYPSGTLTSTAIAFDGVANMESWDQLLFSNDVSQGTITYDVQYWDGFAWQNTAILGATNSPVDLTPLDPYVTNTEIRVRANFTAGTDTPTLYDWTVTWKAPPAISVTNAAVTEGDSGTTNAAFVVTLSGVGRRDATFNYVTSNGTALAGSDYTAASGLVTVPAGQLSATVTVSVAGETIYEDDELFYVLLSSPTNVTITNAVGVGTIVNDDAAPVLALNDVTVTEGDSGTTNAIFTVSLAGGSEVASSVEFATSNGTAVAGSDYVATNGTLNFAVGQTSTTLTVRVNGETLYEGAEAFAVLLSAPSGASLGDGTGVGTIANDDVAPALSMSDGGIVETDSGASNLYFTVTLSEVSGVDATFDFVTSNGTALAGSDYVSTNGSGVIPAGQLASTFAVAVIGDTNEETFVEFFYAGLVNPGDATVADDTGVGQITDNDSPVEISINNAVETEGDSGTTSMVFTVTLSEPSSGAVQVSYATSNGTAVAVSDYAAAGGTLTFGVGQTSTNIVIAIVGDTEYELTEYFSVLLSNPVAGTITDNLGMGIILDTDPFRGTIIMFK